LAASASACLTPLVLLELSRAYQDWGRSWGTFLRTFPCTAGHDRVADSRHTGLDDEHDGPEWAKE